MRVLVAFLLAGLMAGPGLGQALKKLGAGDFKTSSTCKQCHEQIYEQWTSSMH